jgi:hypothetical protein
MTPSSFSDLSIAFVRGDPAFPGKDRAPGPSRGRSDGKRSGPTTASAAIFRRRDFGSDSRGPDFPALHRETK